jgi:hypothetical protein
MKAGVQLISTGYGVKNLNMLTILSSEVNKSKRKKILFSGVAELSGAIK